MPSHWQIQVETLNLCCLYLYIRYTLVYHLGYELVLLDPAVSQLQNVFQIQLLDVTQYSFPNIEKYSIDEIEFLSYHVNIYEKCIFLICIFLR